MPVFLTLLCTLLFWGCATRTQTSDPERVVKVTTARRAGIIYKDFAGLATSDDMVTLAFKLSGQVLDVRVSQGERVAKGDLLAELDSRDVELRVAADRSVYEEASSQLRRMKRLLAHQAVSRQDFESAQTRYAQAKSAYENSKDLLKDTRLRAPFSGVIELKYVDNFERVEAGQPILRVVKPQTTTVKFTLPETAVAWLDNPLTRFEVSFDNYRGRKFPARVKDYVKTSSEASGFPVSLTIENPDSLRYRIAPGMSCTVTMMTPDAQPDAISLPLSSIFAPVEGGVYVWVVTRDSCVVRKSVRLGELYGSDRVVVESGVEPGDRVVTAGVYQLRQGEKVRILN